MHIIILTTFIKDISSYTITLYMYYTQVKNYYTALYLFYSGFIIYNLLRKFAKIILVNHINKSFA